MIVHLDGDVVVYRAGFAAEHTLYHLRYVVDDERHSATFDGAKELKAALDRLKEEHGEKLQYVVEPEVWVEPLEAAILNVRSIIRAVCDDLFIDPETELRVYLSGPTNFRDGVATVRPYKGNRDKTRKPVHAAELKEYIRRTYNTVVSDGQEADDDMGIAHYGLYLHDPESTVLATVDKDLDTVPGYHYNFVQKRGYFVDDTEATVNFWRQLISGDPTDNIPGIPGMGKVKAQEFVAENWDNIYKETLALYKKHYPENPEATLLEMARLVYIRRKADEWWNPPKEETDDRVASGDSELRVRVPESVSTEECGV